MTAHFGPSTNGPRILFHLHVSDGLGGHAVSQRHIKSILPKNLTILTTITFWPTPIPTDPNMKCRPKVSAKSTSQLTEGSPCAEVSESIATTFWTQGKVMGWMVFRNENIEERGKSGPFGPNKASPQPHHLWIVPLNFLPHGCEQKPRLRGKTTIKHCSVMSWLSPTSH